MNIKLAFQAALHSVTTAAGDVQYSLSPQRIADGEHDMPRIRHGVKVMQVSATTVGVSAGLLSIATKDPQYIATVAVPLITVILCSSMLLATAEKVAKLDAQADACA